MSQQKDNSGVLFQNKKKTKDSQPDFTGGVTVGGVDYRLAGWTKVSHQGNEYMSLAFTRVAESEGA